MIKTLRDTNKLALGSCIELARYTKPSSMGASPGYEYDVIFLLWRCFDSSKAKYNSSRTSVLPKIKLCIVSSSL